MSDLDPATVSRVERVKAAGGAVSDEMTAYVDSVVRELRANGGYEAANAYFITGAVENAIQARTNVISRPKHQLQ
jgi:hypothetical protein